jgi:hypothetical protein
VLVWSAFIVDETMPLRRAYLVAGSIEVKPIGIL